MNKEALLSLIKDLVAVPSITESACESVPAEMIYKRLSALPYFQENPRNLRLIDTPLEGSVNRLRSLTARVNAAKKTDRTVLLIGHFDVVDVSCYGDFADSAFECDKLGEIFGADPDTLYGRGTMDMKCGDAIETLLIEEFANDRTLFDVNLVMALVGDEENSSAGMRGVLPILAEMQGEGLDFLAALNTEPGEAGLSGASGPMVFLGTLGKLMPSFYVRGCDAHVGNAYNGFSAILTASHLVTYAEGNPDFADPLHGNSLPSWICLDMKSMRDIYSVTVPDKAYAYFNCFTTKNTPSDVMLQMHCTAEQALRKSTQQLTDSYNGLAALGYSGAPFIPKEPVVYTLEELKDLARRRCGDTFDEALREFERSLPPGDMRARGIKCVDFIADRSGAEAPYIVCFFLPPWLPVRSDFTGDPRDKAVIDAARAVEDICRKRYGLEMLEVELFSGLCDLSYVGGRLSDEDLNVFGRNMPGWGEIYSIPLRELQGLGLPVMNLGASGDAPHRKEERLHLKYSLEILPELLKYAIKEISERVPEK